MTGEGEGEGFPRCREARKAGKKAGAGVKVPWLCDEPFRIFFLLGLVASVAGVALWPLLYAGKVSYAVPLVHARVMVEFFLGAMVVGFVSTALPRMTGTWRLEMWELWVLVVLQVVGMVMLLGWGDLRVGDWCFGGGMLFLLVAMGRRFLLGRREGPPAGLLLVIAGMAAAFAGVVMEQISWVVVVGWGSAGQRLLFEAFPLMVMGGAGTVVLRRFFGDEGWGGEWKGWQMGVIGAVVVATAVLEGMGMLVAVCRVLRGGVIGLVMVRSVKWRGATGSLGNALRWGIAMVIAGTVGSGVFLMQRVGMLHLMLIGGMGLVVLVVAARVVLGHSGQGDFLGARLVRVRWVVFLLVLGASTRSVADFVPKIAVTHHIYAAISWAAAVVIWFWWLVPLVVRKTKEG